MFYDAWRCYFGLRVCWDPYGGLRTCFEMVRRLFGWKWVFCLLQKFNCTHQLHESLSSVAGVQVRGRSHRESALLETNSNA
jgi:hypothetical protein